MYLACSERASRSKSLHDSTGLTIKNSYIPHNRQGVPVSGIFNSGHQILPYLKKLKELDPPYEMQLGGVQMSSVDVYDALCTSIANVYHDVMLTGFIDEKRHPMEHKLFHNPNKSVDGPCYAFLVHGLGPAVEGQGFELSSNSTIISSNIKISDNNINSIKCWTK